jgi:two-component system chemotaxis response regulator CheB
VKVVGLRGGQSRPSSARARPARLEAGTIEVVGVGASTGGPAAVHRLLGLLPPTLGAPVVLVQHIPDGFAEGLVRWLSTGSSLAVTIARNGETALPGHVYVAPPGHQMEVLGNCVLRLHDGPPVGGFRPSVSTLFSSLATSFGRAAAGVVLTGMGADGLEGTRALRAAGGIVMAQDEASSVVFGMPRVIARAGLADVVGSVDELALEVARLAGTAGHGRGRR